MRFCRPSCGGDPCKGQLIDYTADSIPHTRGGDPMALHELNAEADSPDVYQLWEKFEYHPDKAIQVIAKGIDFHLEHMHQVFPELVLDLCCYGPIEKGLNTSHASSKGILNLVERKLI